MPPPSDRFGTATAGTTVESPPSSRRPKPKKSPRKSASSHRRPRKNTTKPAQHVRGKQLTCYTADSGADYDDDVTLPSTCRTQPGGKCYSLVQDYVDHSSGRLRVERIYGCLPAEPNAFMLPCGFGKAHNGKTVECCDTGDMCNRHIHPVYTPRAVDLAGLPAEAEAPSFGRTAHVGAVTLLGICGGVAMIIALLIGLLVHCVCRRRGGKTNNDGGGGGDAESPAAANAPVSADTATDGGVPQLVQRTIATEMVFKQPIGCGRFGEVWMAEFHGERVAAKVFWPEAGDVCLHEVDVYKSGMMRHDNIQRFIGSDVERSGRRLLVTHFHELGSVHSVLGHLAAPLSTQQLCRMAYSFAAGLAHLHTEVCGLSGKPAIAHGDLNSGSVLLRRDWQCVIADFGRAVKWASDSDEIRMAPERSATDWRYAAPEFLSGTFAADAIGSYKMGDMYAAGLVLWQMTRCCAAKQAAGNDGTRDDDGPPCEGYALPFAEELPPGRPLRRDDVRRVVCGDSGDAANRPEIPTRWAESEDEVLRTLRGIVVDCWKENAASRLTSLRVKKTLAKLRDNVIA